MSWQDRPLLERRPPHLEKPLVDLHNNLVGSWNTERGQIRPLGGGNMLQVDAFRNVRDNLGNMVGQIGPAGNMLPPIQLPKPPQYGGGY
ncbi:hypothetical protein ACFLSW_00535 [Candidatus Bipolaricaulota bacterium]